jgi:uncharacterized protein YbjT (DUF2867 family)
MAAAPTDLVTGAFSYTGKRVASRLLAAGRRVRTLTNHPPSDGTPSNGIDLHPLDFDQPRVLEEALGGVDTVYNTYWIRFPRGELTYERAVENSRRLIQAARRAEVRRFVHVSIANATEDSLLPYYSGKARVEAFVRDSGLSYAIARPTVIHGGGDVLVNNIAWFLRHLPVFAIPGSGRYRVQPVYVEDHADLLVHLGGSVDNTELDSVGPEVFPFEELVRLIHRQVGSRTLIVKTRGRLVLRGLGLVGPLLRDVVLTADEVQGLMQELLISTGRPTCPTSFREWLAANAQSVGRRYASELARHFRAQPA